VGKKEIKRRNDNRLITEELQPSTLWCHLAQEVQNRSVIATIILN